jgi:hypothetical protein
LSTIRQISYSMQYRVSDSFYYCTKTDISSSYLGRITYESVPNFLDAFLYISKDPFAFGHVSFYAVPLSINLAESFNWYSTYGAIHSAIRHKKTPKKVKNAERILLRANLFHL